ncbi:DNA repair protein Rad23, putatitve, putative [Babesia bigemina]|uniref:UV excision repair protein RAD23 n=1 Tax=Babesia bigemina TaxID=5866 RepID=A0A061D606_BABBI|nr:DNA repair protein Rad23, putatitve, putative [Babesia bigemina]CDR94344.1 DNA repair protein Rad23, putatitve, putative [Babesia bigemina]|eukprot:XP_012766530.1 DNA repair protein Rad23, putatitve, putative [Babesia bigemina]
MKLKIKTLNNLEAEVDVEADITVADLMKAVEAALPALPSDRQKLIHSGKVLKRELRLSDYSDIKDGDKVIVITSKQPPTVSTAPVVEQPVSPPEVQPSATAVSTEPLASASSRFVTGSELEMNISRICEMGFPRAEVEQAMAAAFNNPERAVEFLSTGNIPSPGDFLLNPGVDDHQPSNNAMHAASQDVSLQSIQSHPAFQQIRQALNSDPQMLQQLLENIGSTNPELLQNIVEHQDEFMNMLNSAGGADPLLSGDDGPAVVQLTEEDVAIVERLEGLGFPRPAVIEAFLACDKNEEMAANYLLENANDFASEE